MSKPYYRRRYYGRRKNNSSSGSITALLILAVIAYTHSVTYSRSLKIATTTGLGVLTLIVVGKVWRWHRREIARPIRNETNAMTGLQFERYVASLLRKRGFTSVRLTERYDLGVDIVARKDGVTWGVQVKRYSNPVKAAAVRQVYTALVRYKCNRAMVVSNNTYSRPATILAKDTRTVLIDGAKLARWAYESRG